MGLFEYLIRVKKYSYQEAHETCGRYNQGHHLLEMDKSLSDEHYKDVLQWYKEEKDKPRQW